MCAPPKNPIIGSCYKKGSERASGGPWLKLSINAYAMAPEGNEFVPLYANFTPFVSLMQFPMHMGSKFLSNITVFATAFLPCVNTVIAFEADRNNISTNSKADETWDCRISTMDTYHGRHRVRCRKVLCKHNSFGVGSANPSKHAPLRKNPRIHNLNP